jgi:hypothetical protein
MEIVMRIVRSGGTLAAGRLLLGITLGFFAASALEAGQERGTPRANQGDHWLEGTPEQMLEQVESQLRGLDVAMIEIGYRFTELHFAGEDENWAYARYQAEKIRTALELALERRPKRAASSAPFLREDLPSVLQAIERKHGQGFREAMDRLRSSCMGCHIAEQVPHFTVYPPERRLSTIRTVR